MIIVNKFYDICMVQLLNGTLYSERKVKCFQFVQ